jgi:hypothetical protein
MGIGRRELRAVGRMLCLFLNRGKLGGLAHGDDGRVLDFFPFSFWLYFAW